ncbi:MAG: hypothetical protein KY456_10530 [Chloroflexi bacterium]|nr:hypothetical protein [Chloroflexota bacterium]
MSVDRTVQFWQVVQPRSGAPLAGTFPSGELVRALKSVEAEETLWETRDGWRLMAAGFKERSPQHIGLARIRREGLPYIEQGGRFSDLELADDQNLAEVTHYRFFPRNVVGLLYNFDGPHVRRLAQYLRGRWDVDVDLVPVLRRDVAQALERMTELSIVDVAIPVDRAYLLEDDGSDTVRALREMAENSESKVLYAKFSLRGSATPHAGASWLRRIQGFATSSQLGAFKKLRVKGFDADAQERIWLDLIAEHLTLVQDVELTSDAGRAVRPRSAADAIQDAYDVLEDDINAAVARVAQIDPPLRMSDLGAEAD